VRGARHAGAVRNCGRIQLVDVEHLECARRSDDVDDGIERADFVEVHLLRRSTVDAPLSSGQRLERGQRTLPHSLGQAGLLDHRGDVAVRADHRRLLTAHDHVRRRHPGA
jgi:hypothetical protein